MTDEMTAAEYVELNRMSEADQVKWLRDRVAKDAKIVGMSKPVVPFPDRYVKRATELAEATRPKVLDELEEFLELGKYGRVWKEHQFHPTRKWRADYFLPDQSPEVIVEYDGINRQSDKSGSAHASIAGVVRDAEKGNEAQALGYRFYRFNAVSLGDGSAYEFLTRVLKEVP